MKDEALEVHFGIVINAGRAVKGEIGNPHFLFGKEAAVMDKGLVYDFRQHPVADHGEISMGNIAARDELENHSIKEITYLKAYTLFSASSIHQHDITAPRAFNKGQNRRRIIFAVGVHHDIPF